MHLNFTTIVLAHQDHKERDRLYTLFTRELGKIVVRGSGARKSGAKLAPHLEPMMLSYVAIAKNRGRGTLTFALCEDSFYHIREDDFAFSAVRGVLGMAKHLLRDEDPHRDVYDLLLAYLWTMDALAAHSASKTVLSVVTQGFYFHLLALLGWSVQTRQCVRCIERLEKSVQYTYLLSDGGFICKKCRVGMSISEKQKIVLSRDAAAALHVFETHHPSRSHLANLAKLTVPQKVCDELALLTKRRIAWVV